MTIRVLLEDGFSVEKGTGVGRYTQSLANELRRQPEIELLPQPTRGSMRNIRPLVVRRTVYAAWLETGFQKQVKKLRPDLIHFTNHLVPRSRKTKAKYVVTIHDLTGWKLPEAFSPFYVRYIHAVVPRAVKLADLVLCPSDAIRREVIERFSLEEKKVRTAWNADPRLPELSAPTKDALLDQFRKRLGLQKPFVLFVGTLERRKNVKTLVEAFARVAETKDMQLVLVGRPGFGFSEVEGEIKHQAMPDRYILPGFVSDEELALLYAHADVFAYPSRYEGFGIPLVEAMSHGLPIVASRIPASEEVAAGAAVFYGDPMDDKALAGKILEVLGSPTLRSELGSHGRARAKKFSWENVAGMYIEAYKSSLSLS